ncbi:hypothetical protein N658DRAFT_358242 [Parathielavia hyrcaniae]|uniref:Uncharacterized protein n=1 Tax=Parathielavia hyrcaniae TaxID=113614 RepID=A0AAN6Q2A2_9PEZI|nr:hypothetical protein N658DRAFT_358242 [Parathielavia hyrcaniae]
MIRWMEQQEGISFMWTMDDYNRRTRAVVDAVSIVSPALRIRTFSSFRNIHARHPLYFLAANPSPSLRTHRLEPCIKSCSQPPPRLPTLSPSFYFDGAGLGAGLGSGALGYGLGAGFLTTGPGTPLPLSSPSILMVRCLVPAIRVVEFWSSVCGSQRVQWCFG